MKSLIAMLRSLDSFYPEGNAEFQRNLKQESDVLRILCYKEEQQDTLYLWFGNLSGW